MKEKDKSDSMFDLALYFFDLIVFTGIEVAKTILGQPISIFMVNVSMFSILLLIIERRFSTILLLTIILFYELSNSVSWFMNQTPINFQVIDALDFQWMLNYKPEFIVTLVIIFISCLIAISVLPFYSYHVNFRCRSYYILNAILFVTLFNYLLNKIHDYNGEHSAVMFNQINNDLIEKLVAMINEKPRIVEKEEKLKNLILFQIETFEYSAITPTSMPYFTNLTKKYLYIDNIDSSIYTTWSTAGNLVTQCGIPQIITSLKWDSRSQDSMAYYKKVLCMSDYLKTIGYAAHSFAMTHDYVMDYHKWRNDKYIRTFDALDDKILFDYMNTNGTDFLRNISKNQNYIAMIYTQDTHRPQVPKKYCTPENPSESLPRQTYNCLDQLLRRFVDRFIELKMYEDTVMVMYGDHTMFGTPFSSYRKLVMLFPGYEKRNYTLPLTYYDFAPTIYEMIGIKKIYPGLPFGRSMFSNLPPNVPTFQDLNIMFHYFHSELKIKTKRKGFECHGYNGRLCNDTNII